MTTEQNQQQPQPATPAKGALERLVEIENAVGALVAQNEQYEQLFQYVAQEMTATKSALAGMTKTVAGLVKILTTKGLVSDPEIMGEIRAIDDENDKERLQKLLAGNMIEVSEVADPEALVVVTQRLVQDDGKVIVLAKHRTYEMPAPYLDKSVFFNLLGKKKGDVVQLNPAQDGSGKIIAEVKQVYRLKQKGNTEGEAPALKLAEEPTKEASGQPSETQPEATQTPAQES